MTASQNNNQDNVHSSTKQTSLPEHNEEMCVTKLCRTQLNSEFKHGSEMFFEINKEYKVTNILVKEGTAVGL